MANMLMLRHIGPPSEMMEAMRNRTRGVVVACDSGRMMVPEFGCVPELVFETEKSHGSLCGLAFLLSF